MIENPELFELKEQFSSTAEVDQVIGYYTRNSLDALADGHTDMKAYYDAKIDELYEIRKEFVKQESKIWHEQFSERMEKSKAETEELLQEIKMDKAIHGAPRYGGNLEYRESEWIYEAEKEYRKHGETARYKELLKNAKEAHVKEALD